MHAPWLPGGWLGVDIFFVLSGFVITAKLSRTPYTNTKTILITFYLNRIKRLLPALTACILITALLTIALTTRPAPEIFRTGAFALLGGSNYYLYHNELDYFALYTGLNPFLHTWSLGIEEQFYLFYPGLMIYLGLVGQSPAISAQKKRAFSIMAIFSLISLLAFLIASQLEPMAAFYWLPLRAWELGAGGLAHLYCQQSRSSSAIAPGYTYFFLSLATLGLFAFPLPMASLSTVAMVTITAILLIIITTDPPNSRTRRLLCRRPLVYAGMISYSLYLWHWPIIVLGQQTLGVEGISSLFLLPIILSFSLLSYYGIERPLRYYPFTQPPGRLLVISWAVIGLLFPVIWLSSRFAQAENNGLARWLHIPAVEDWADAVDCHGIADLAQYPYPLEHCLAATRTAEKPAILYLLGDSHAAQWFFPLEKILAATPFQLRFINDKTIPDTLLDEQAVSASLDYVWTHAQAGDWVLMTFHRGRLNPIRDRHLDSQQPVLPTAREKTLTRRLGAQIAAFHQRSIAVVLIRDTPLLKTITPSPTCLLQKRLWGHNQCQITQQQDLYTRTRQDRVYNELQRRFAGLNGCIWDPLPFLYNQHSRWDAIDAHGHYQMTDWNHLSRATALQLAPALNQALQQCYRQIQAIPPWAGQGYANPGQ